MRNLRTGLSLKHSIDQDWPDLADADLIAIWLSAGLPVGEANAKAALLSSQLGASAALSDLTLSELQELGINDRLAQTFLAIRELLRRSRRKRLVPGTSFQSSAAVFEYFRPLLADMKKECFWALLLDGKNRIQRAVRISEGSLTRSIVHPREVFRPAIREAAAGLLFLHNHPSGDPEPSEEDIQITKRLVETGKVVGIRVLDHVIIGAYRYFSFADAGML